jgi:hypothetical protein
MNILVCTGTSSSSCRRVLCKETREFKFNFHYTFWSLYNTVYQYVHTSRYTFWYDHIIIRHASIIIALLLCLNDLWRYSDNETQCYIRIYWYTMLQSGQNIKRKLNYMNYNMMDEFLSHKLPISLWWKTGSLMVNLVLLPSHISWKLLLASQQNDPVWTALWPQILIVKAYDAIMSKYRLVCDKHEKQDEKITRIRLQTALKKTALFQGNHVGTGIALVACNKYTSIYHRRPLIHQNGQCAPQLHYPRVSRRKVSDVTQDCVIHIQPWCPEWSLSSSFYCHKCKHPSLYTVLINAINCFSVQNLVTRKFILMKMTCCNFIALCATKNYVHTSHLTDHT